MNDYITINEKNIYLPADEEAYEIGSLLTDFLELDLTDFKNSVERIKKFNKEDIKTALSRIKSGKFYKGYASILFPITDEMQDEEKYIKIELYNALMATKHPYVYAVEYTDLEKIDYKKLFEIFDLVKLQKEYRDLVNACLLKQDGKDSFNPIQRYFEYPNKPKDRAEIIYTVSENYSLNEEYIAPNISSLLYLEFIKMLQYNVFVKKCENCGRLFAVRGNYNKKYCDRKIGDTSKTCQEVGATNSFKNKVLNNSIIGEYQRAYKRLYARKRTGKITKEELERQIKKATVLRDKAIAGSLNMNDYEEQITKI